MTRRIIIMTMLSLLVITTKAQTTEKDLIGSWETIETYGNDWDIPVVVEFKNNGDFIYTDSRGTIKGCGFVLGNGGETLHLFSRNDFNGWAQFTMVNLYIGTKKTPDDSNFHLLIAPYGADIYNGGRYCTMQRKDAPSSVRSVTRTVPADSTKYNLQGQPVEHPRGIYIQSGEKRVGR